MFGSAESEHPRLTNREIISEESVFELHGSQSMPGPLTCYDGPLTMRKIPGTEGAAVGPSLLCKRDDYDLRA